MREVPRIRWLLHEHREDCEHQPRRHRRLGHHPRRRPVLDERASVDLLLAVRRRPQRHAASATRQYQRPALPLHLRHQLHLRHGASAVRPSRQAGRAHPRHGRRRALAPERYTAPGARKHRLRRLCRRVPPHPDGPQLSLGHPARPVRRVGRARAEPATHR